MTDQIQPDDLRAQYGEMADLSVDELRDRARRLWGQAPSHLDRKELLVALSGGGYPRRE
jgi:hypothetical protein